MKNQKIKFKAYCNKTNKMITTFDGISDCGENYGNIKSPKLLILMGGYEWCHPTWGTDIELLQYTGLKDKEGKEIYEEDILEDFKGKHFRVFRVAGGFAINTHSEDFNKPNILFYTSIADMQMASYIQDCKIIGNTKIK